MAINLQKGQRIDLTKKSGESLTQFCVGCNWGVIEVSSGFLGFGKKSIEVDLDLSCVMLNSNGELCDHIYSPLYKPEFLARYGLPKGKVDSNDRALHHSGDDRKGDEGGDDGLDNEIITVDLTRVSNNVDQIFFFLNNCGKEDFSQIPYAAIRMYEGTATKVKETFAQYDVAAESQYKGKLAVIMGRLYRKNGEWKFAAIGDAFEDSNLCLTIKRIVTNYNK
ncbi:MAG: TerD family protein [Rikenellaceae bacterium]